MTEARCETCRYGQRTTTEGSPWHGLCRRYPPPPVGLPHVARLDWCGEWAPREQQPWEREP